MRADSDETAPALWSLHVLKGADIDPQRQAGSTFYLEFMDKWFPTLYGGGFYTFALPSYMMLPVFAVLGVNVLAFKLFFIFLVWMTIMMLFYIIRRWFGTGTALLTVTFLVFSPLFIHYSTVALDTSEMIINFFFIGAVFHYLLYIRKRPSPPVLHLMLAAFMLGAGFSIKLSMASRILGLLPAAFFLKESAGKMKIRLRYIMPALAFFLLGSSLMIVYNWNSGWDSFRVKSRFFSNRMEEDGYDSLSAIFSRRAAQLAETVREKPDTDSFPSAAGRSSIEGYIVAFLIAAAFIFNLMYSLIKKERRTEILAVYSFYAVMFLSSVLSPVSISRYHLSMLYPFPQFILALAIVKSYRMLSSRFAGREREGFNRVAPYIVFIIVPVYLSVNGLGIKNMFETYRKTGGSDYSMNMVPAVIDYIEDNGLFPVYNLNWDIQETASLITGGRNPLRYDLIHLDVKDRAEKIRELLKDNGRIYLLDAPWADFTQYDIVLEPVKIFKNRAGQTSWKIYKAEM